MARESQESLFDQSWMKHENKISENPQGHPRKKKKETEYLFQ